MDGIAVTWPWREGIAVGAGYTYAEIESDPEASPSLVEPALGMVKERAIIVVAEGATTTLKPAGQVFDKHKDRLGFNIPCDILGQVQRGGEPGAFDDPASCLAAVNRSYSWEEYGVVFGLKIIKLRHAFGRGKLVAKKKQNQMKW